MDLRKKAIEQAALELKSLAENLLAVLKMKEGPKRKKLIADAYEKNKTALSWLSALLNWQD